MFTSEKMVKFLREKYPPGTRIRLVSMEDPYAPVAPGTEGTLVCVDDAGQFQMKWDNGRTLALIPGEDSFTVLPPERSVLKLYMPLTAELYEPDEWGDMPEEAERLTGGELASYEDKIRSALFKNRMEKVYAQLSVWRGRAVTAEERSNAVKIYSMVMGSAGSGTYNGAYEPGGNAPMELEASMFTDPATKNSADLAIYAANAWNSGWGYVWGTFGQVLTPELLQYKISQYPEGVGDEADFIRSHWLNRRTTDCVGLIKGYGWLNTVTMEIQYGSNGMPDVGADGMYYNAGHKGSIETMPNTPGLAVWKSGHIGVYIGNGEVIEAMDTRYGVVKTKLQGRGWTHWLEVPGIKYD